MTFMRLPTWADPSLLTHPNVPKPLHQVNPRSIRGKTWWDKVRRETYAVHGDHCFACGVHKSRAKGNRKWLEAHERYDIDAEAGRVYFRGLVALCPWCHQFIHSGRLFALYQKGEVSKDFAWGVLTHGMNLLDRCNKERGTDLKPFWFTLVFAYMLSGNRSIEDALDIVRKKVDITDGPAAPWEEWRLILDDGSEHGPKFETYESWLEEFGADVSQTIDQRGWK